ncbi:MAG: hypothetical protein ACE5D3_01285, partial [Candidatus Binatia bacterium]
VHVGRVLIAVMIVLSLAGPAVSADVLQGEILDMACFIARGEKGRGPLHAGCALACAKKGLPLGLITDDGAVYLLYPKHGKEKSFERVKELAGQLVTLTGIISEHDGVKGIEVGSVEARN